MYMLRFLAIICGRLAASCVRFAGLFGRAMFCVRFLFFCVRFAWKRQQVQKQVVQMNLQDFHSLAA